MDSSNVTLLTLIGDCYAELKLISHALHYYEAAFYKDIQNATLAIKMANLVLSNKENVALYGNFMSRLLNHAISRTPESFPLRQTLGALKYTDKQYPETKKIFSRLLKEGDTSRITLKYLGLVEYQQENYNAALPFLEKAYPLYLGGNDLPVDIDLAMKYGEVFCRTDFCSDALDIFEVVEKTIQPDKKSLSLLEAMKAMSYTFTMKRDKAVEAYWKAYKWNPNNTGAIANLAYLSNRTLDSDGKELSEKDKK